MRDLGTAAPGGAHLCWVLLFRAAAGSGTDLFAHPPGQSIRRCPLGVISGFVFAAIYDTFGIF